MDLKFIDRAQDLVLYGDVSTGKTHLAIALAAAACTQGYRAKYFTTAGLVMHLRRAKDDHRLDKELAMLARQHVLILDLCRGRDYVDKSADGWLRSLRTLPLTAFSG